MEEIEQNEFESPVPYKVHERDMARMERANKRLWITILALVVLLVATNAGWLYYESQWEDVTITAEQTADGESNNYAIGGDYIGGEAESNNQTQSP